MYKLYTIQKGEETLHLKIYANLARVNPKLLSQEN